MTVPDSGNDSSRGMILLVVLWAITLMTVIVVALSAFAQRNISLAGVETDRLRSELALEAGLAVAGGLILAQKPEDRVYLNGAPTTVDIGDGKLVEIRVSDTAGLVDFNRADPALMTSLVELLNLEATEVAALQSAIKTLRKAEGEEGGKTQAPAPATQEEKSAAAQQPDESGEKKPQIPVLVSPAQLLAFDGVSPKTLDKLLPFITLYSSDGKVNPMAAPELVLQSIPDLTPAERKILLDSAALRIGQSEAVKTVIQEHETYLSEGQPKTFAIGLKIVSGPGVIAGSRLNASIVLDEAGKSPFQVLAWSW